MSDLTIPHLDPRYRVGTSELSLGWTRDQVAERYGAENMIDRYVDRYCDDLTLDDDFREERRAEDEMLHSAIELQMEVYGVPGYSLVQFDIADRVVYIQWRTVPGQELIMPQAATIEQHLLDVFGPALRSKSPYNCTRVWEDETFRVVFQARIAKSKAVKQIWVLFQLLPSKITRHL